MGTACENEGPPLCRTKLIPVCRMCPEIMKRVKALEAALSEMLWCAWKQTEGCRNCEYDGLDECREKQAQALLPSDKAYTGNGGE